MSDACNATCGGGMLTMTRQCTNPAPRCGGANCTGLSEYEKQCNTQCCPGTKSSVCTLIFYIIILLYYIVDGGWGNWTITTECTRTCGGGILVMGRSCDNPTPYCRGKRCTGASRMRLTCNTQCCRGKNTAIHTTLYQYPISCFFSRWWLVRLESGRVLCPVWWRSEKFHSYLY